MSKKKEEECAEGAPLWMTTFADMVTLLLTFFVLLLSFSTIEIEKFRAMVGSIKGELGIIKGRTRAIASPSDQMGLSASDPNSAASREQREQQASRMTRRMRRKINTTISALKIEDENFYVSRTQDNTTLRIQLPSSMLFGSGSSRIERSIYPLLDSIVVVLKSDSGYIIRVEGHTDSMPISTSQFPSNWELSASRAASLVRYFQNKGIAPEIMHAVGKGEFEPLESNSTSSGRDKNRRVEIYIEFNSNSANTINNLYENY